MLQKMTTSRNVAMALQLLYTLCREFEETMDALQNDIDSLESEKSAIQTKLNNLTKKQMYDSLTKGTSNIGSAVGMLSRLYLPSQSLFQHRNYHLT